MSDHNGLSVLDGYKPSDFGLDEYSEYRRHPETQEEIQLQVIEHLAYSDKRFAVASAPVGVGKSLIALTLAKLTGLRTCIGVPYKGLEDQYATTFSKHVVDVRGRGNYDCGDYQNLDCKSGVTMGCRYAVSKTCTYDVVKSRARDAQVVVTNYDYWLNINDHAGGIERTQEEAKWFGANPIELLILDEGDESAEKVAEYLAVRVYEGDIRRWVPDAKHMSDDIRQWQTMIKDNNVIDGMRDEIRTMGMELAHLGKKASKQQIQDLHKQERLLGSFLRIQSIQDDWVCEAKIGTRFGRQWAFEVVWPGRYTEQYLFRGIQKVVIMSGTITPKDMSLLGVKKELFDYRQWDRIFPAKTQPIYLLTAKKTNDEGKLVSIRVDRKSSEQDLRQLLELMDQIIDSRLDRKVLIGTSSYDWQKFIMENSRHADIMVGNTNDADSDSASEVAEDFYNMSAPRVLVSPSFGRGWDFSYERAEVAILFKCPFVPLQSKVMKARLKRDEHYGSHVTIKKVEQFNGRIKRAPDDRGECFLLDGHFEYFLYRADKLRLSQSWFVKSVKKVDSVPPAPMKLLPRKVK